MTERRACCRAEDDIDRSIITVQDACGIAAVHPFAILLAQPQHGHPRCVRFHQLEGARGPQVESS